MFGAIPREVSVGLKVASARQLLWARMKASVRRGCIDIGCVDPGAAPLWLDLMDFMY